MASKGMDRSGSSQNFTPVHCAASNEMFLACIYWNPLPVNDERVATLHDQHVFVIVMHLFGGNRAFGTGPKCHLAAVFPIEDVTFNSRRCLIRARNPVGGILHELGEDIHAKNTSASLEVNWRYQGFTSRERGRRLKLR